ncbi:MAG: pseudouridine synthase [Candidatus Eremiobacteraeota bacterium]|nr:pseudouridine synthase [Candidatus Eremiobacteraeota bacterium]
MAARRKADALIAAGRVHVDGRPAIIGERVDLPRQRVTVDGEAVEPVRAPHVILVLNKPQQVISTMDDEHRRPTLRRFVPAGRRLFAVGRLDAQTTGVLLFTSDGELCRVLSHPRFGVPKCYRVTVTGTPTPHALDQIGAGGVQPLGPGQTEFVLTLRQGPNRHVRRMCAALGLRVIRLERISFGPVGLGDLAPGHVRAVTAAEREALERLGSAAK